MLGSDRQHANFCCAFRGFHVNAGDDFRAILERQDRRSTTKQRQHLFGTNALPRNQIGFMSPAALLRQGPVGAIYERYDSLDLVP